ncbi:MAG: HGGxSTG domain-containing protein [Dongiaceae bacterium]
MIPQSIAPAATLPPDRRGRLRNGATPGDFLAAPRCAARTRAGGCCRQPAMRNGRCRMHGGLSTGPRTAEGRARCASARRTHGFYSAEITALRRAGTAYCRRMDALFAALKAGRTAGHGVHPSFPACPLDSARPLPQPAPRRGFVQRTLLGGTALGLGLTIAPPAAAGHGVHPSFSRRAG